MIIDTFNTVFRTDITAQHSQTLVRLLARMIKEKKFQVHPNVLSCLLHLRLRGELDAMRQGKKGKQRENARDAKGWVGEKKYKSDTRKKWQTKNQKKREKEMKEVEKEMAEAEAEVDVEERAQIVSTYWVVLMTANGNVEKLVCPVLFDLETPRAVATAAGCARGYLPFRPFG
jgi:nucleolar complex protein 3